MLISRINFSNVKPAITKQSASQTTSDSPQLKLLTNDTFTKSAQITQEEPPLSLGERIKELFSSATFGKIKGIFTKALVNKFTKLLKEEVFDKILDLFNKDLVVKIFNFLNKEVFQKIKTILEETLLGKTSENQQPVSANNLNLVA